MPIDSVVSTALCYAWQPFKNTNNIQNYLSINDAFVCICHHISIYQSQKLGCKILNDQSAGPKTIEILSKQPLHVQLFCKRPCMVGGASLPPPPQVQWCKTAKYLQNLRLRPHHHWQGAALRGPPKPANANHEGVSCFTPKNSNLGDSEYFTDFTCLFACTGSLLGLLTFAICLQPVTAKYWFTFWELQKITCKGKHSSNIRESSLAIPGASTIENSICKSNKKTALLWATVAESPEISCQEASCANYCIRFTILP